MVQPAASSAADFGMTVDYASLNGFCAELLRRAGLCEADARLGADVLATTDAWGVFTHGTKLMRGYLKRLLAGGLKPRGRPAVVAEGGAWAVVDGDSALGMVTSVFAMRTAMAKARANGIGYSGVRNTCHFGAAGYYSVLAAKEGLVGLCMANDLPSVAAPGSRGAVTGTNPISYAIPSGRYRPMFLDMSIATVAGGKVYAAKERGEPVPDTWLIGADGRPTTDPSRYPSAGALAPAAGHKGYGLALLIETLSGVLTGAGFTWGVRSWMTDDPALPTNHGAAFLAIDCDALMPSGEFASRMEKLIDEIHAAPRAAGIERIYVPGEKEWDRYDDAMATGITLPPDVVHSLREAAAVFGLDLERDLVFRAMQDS
ncbi:MAG: Ldh family oxidoreductase [Candidatus Limnocylindrales bacterium]|jgi:LDH2 family malate/lactate/ureidoglycolate dehydrogenase